ncbi:MAG TPA: AAA family ATPase [Pirellulales bacterium]|jgi:general secretion pathway protein A
MYESYWRFQSKPFTAGVDTRAYYPSETHQGALLKLRYAVENRRGAALLVGPSGSGKTLLVRLLADQLGDEFRPLAHLVFPQMPAADLLAFLAAELGAGSAEHSEGRVASVETSVRRIQHRLTENAQQGKHAVVAIDEAHLLDGSRAFEAIRLLLNFETAAGPALTLLLVGQTALVPMFARMPQLEERLAVKCMLRPLAVEETMAYVQHRLAVAGSDRTIFEPSATEALHHLSCGIPRQINRLCDLALLIGFAEEQSSIGAEQIEAVSQELVSVATE